MEHKDPEETDSWKMDKIEDLEDATIEESRTHIPLSMSARILALGVLLMGVFVLSTNTAINHISTGWFPISH